MSLSYSCKTFYNYAKRDITSGPLLNPSNFSNMAVKISYRSHGHLYNTRKIILDVAYRIINLDPQIQFGSSQINVHEHEVQVNMRWSSAPFDPGGTIIAQL
ncbi:hypothetical protein HanPI659440_Chr06g0221891 [Helianthus annuus]|nr:hypothetical protein HanIR_Chr06g0259361 [Helianthus annuus]KAJ0779016.1 hypothetical protein HanPI659440_Chr06g0221891 [Helianthus annuus]